MMNHGVTASGRHDLDIWHVRFAGGETRALSLDELSEAFNEGWIDERTPVLKAGAIFWAPLGEVAGLDDAPPPAPISSVPNSIAPLALDAYPTPIPFDLDAPLDAEGDADLLALRPRRGKQIFGVITAMVVVAGLGLAAFRGKPLLQRALASGHAKPTTAIVAQAPTQPAPPAPVIPPPAPPAPVQTLTATSLPNAPQTAAEKAAEKKAAIEAEKKAAAEARKAKKKR